VELLARGASRLGITLTKDQLEKLRTYCDELIEWNQRFNLTAIAERDQIQLKHFLDSLTVLLVWRGAPSSSVIDVGAGAGFPSIPLKIACPRLRLTLVEATGKKADFLQHIIQVLNLDQTEAVHARAEDLGHDSTHRERYDLVLARAVAALPELLEYGIPFATLGGIMIAHKGASAPQEAHDSGMALSVLGGQLERLVPVELPGVTEERQLVLIRKVARTPANYPRRPGIPHKRPLGSSGEAKGDGRDDLPGEEAQ
jgi:16S rRNA (guanine527-N7)-methyltransferase